MQALGIIQGLRRSMESELRTQDALKAMVLEVSILHAIGEGDKALQLLRTCLRKAQPQSSIRLFVDEGAPMHALLGHLREDQGLAATGVRRTGAAGCRGAS